MISSQIREKAREDLKNNWGKAALVTFVFVIATYIITIVCALIPIVGPIASMVIFVPFSYGLTVCFIKLKRGETVGYLEFASIGFNSFAKVWAVAFRTILKMIVPVVLIVLFTVMILIGTAGAIAATLSYASASASGFVLLFFVASIGLFITSIYASIKEMLYSLNNYLLYDNPDMPAKEIVEKSATLMYGNRWKLFCLILSFIGWAILASFTFGIGMLWLIPYITISIIVFYENLAGINNY